MLPYPRRLRQHGYSIAYEGRFVNFLNGFRRSARTAEPFKTVAAPPQKVYNERKTAGEEGMQTIVVASGNKGKLREIAEIFTGFSVVSMQEAGFAEEIEETGETFAENALIKARAVCKALGQPALADDSGLCVDALGGAPGVYSARFCGRHGDDAANNELLLEKLASVPEEGRGAYFESCVALVFPDGRELTASGRAYGRILTAPQGTGGFGYDPLFYSTELEKGFGVASAAEKNAVSHRGKALRALAAQMEGMR